ncbi:DEAD/DEAH box helicase family protein [Sporosarcina saromensis]|uniref:DEAD/DEAH box helicase family protein n=1 Tax=Sporosarcina saromensis TaxID=359365 RepID=A0ABU4G6K2_9BACL|nr:DEAD/DEAH box helicase family protein [Sporosarcina saromensis]MDW0112590.1 DEAD/DEAH box helicase family protein [Sporosarcina saromensis]
MRKQMNPAIRNFLSGRIWLRMHTPFASHEIDEQIAAGTITVIKGIRTENGSLFQPKRHICNRCENGDASRFTTFQCAKCEGPCTYCRNCLKMGRVSSCTELITWTGPPIMYPTDHTLAWQGTLTPKQQQASDELLESQNKSLSHLLYAVCGSGKTEILFQPIHAMLRQGKRVGIAAPRVDVILELEPRLRAAFPQTSIEALYGGAQPSMEAAQLVLATTHQLYRFTQAFDAIFVDEADAFPYKADATLQRAVMKAAKPETPVHSVTATPSDKLLRERKKTGAVSIIYRRYHGHPLPMPVFHSLWNYEKQIQKGTLPRKLLQWTEERIAKNEPFLLFFHHIGLMEAAEPLFQTIHPQIRSVHAQHPDRKEHVQALRDQQVPGLLTTTILERGITIPNVQVAVIGAEQAIFDKGALIQIGGRVGRSALYPTGQFTLFHNGISYAMDEAKNEIRRLNEGGDM